MDLRSLELELKEVAEDGAFSGIASAYGVEDLDGDVIDKGAFTKTLSENPEVPVLWQHDSREVIGLGSVKEWQGKIRIDGKLDLDDPAAQKAYRKMQSKLVKGLSIGFTTIKSTWQDIEGRMVRHIQELKLWEVSVVTFPALPSAQVTRVKELELELKTLKETVSALQATKATPQEPAPGTEPPPSNPEPVEDHSESTKAFSGIAAEINEFKRAIERAREGHL